ncbi:hypothetical protein, partial [Burkholderia multivorans]|uniref:hypothetical protein n=1 Tax=Burkholderia multivorans TaxID=87883 RepID=UPI00286FF096
MPRAVAFGAVAAFRRWCTRACIVVATRRTRSRHIVVPREHWIAKQVERAFVPLRIGGCRALRLR